MTGWIKRSLVVGLLAGTAAAPVLAQHHDGPNGNRNSRQAVNSRHANYREVTTSRGHKWRKGQRLAANQRRYVVSDWNQRGLRAPPRGYQWVREDNNTGDFILVAAATGLIASILSQ